MEEGLLRYLFDLGVGMIALYALILTLRGRNKQSEGDNVLAVQLVGLVAGFKTAIEKQTEVLSHDRSEQVSLLTSQTASIVANTQAVAVITAKIGDDFMPKVLNAFTQQEQKLAAEIRPLVEQLSKVYFSVREMQNVIEKQQAMDAEMTAAAKAHWQAEAETLSNLRAQQSMVQNVLATCAEKVEQIFNRMVEVATADEVVLASANAVEVQEVAVIQPSDATKEIV